MLQHIDNEEEKPFLDEEDGNAAQKITKIRRQSSFPWIISAISWGITIYLLLSTQWQNILSLTTSTQNATSYIHDDRCKPFLPTDLTAMRLAIEYETRVFTGSLDWDPVAKQFERIPSIDGPEYVGPPNPSIDAAWDDLLHHEWTPMTDEEAAPYTPYLRPWAGHYMYEPDVYHSLHCVNELRKHIDNEYYNQTVPDDWQKDWTRIHMDHCLDQLRQAVMCFGDLAPVPLYSWDGAKLGIGRGSTHTCRKWAPIRKWTDQRRMDMNITT